MFKMGHTFLYRKDAQMHYQYYKKNSKKEHYIIDASIIDFLVTHGVLKEDITKDYQKRLHLMRYWKAEESIFLLFKVF